MITKATYIGGPLDGLSKTFDWMPTQTESVAISVDGLQVTKDPTTKPSQFVQAAYRPQPLGESNEYVLMMFAGDWGDFRRFASPVQSDLLCAHCGRDPATGEEVN